MWSTQLISRMASGTLAVEAPLASALPSRNLSLRSNMFDDQVLGLTRTVTGVACSPQGANLLLKSPEFREGIERSGVTRGKRYT